MIRFKKNDKVRGKGSSDFEGCEGIIVKVRIDGYDIKLTKLGSRSYHGKDEWVIGGIIGRNIFWEGCLELIKKEDRKPTHIILYDNVYHISYGKKDRDEKIKGLIDDKEVNNDDITIYDIKNESKVICEVDIEEI